MAAWDDLGRAELPAIASLRDGNFVILARVKTRSPAKDVRQIGQFRYSNVTMIAGPRARREFARMTDILKPEPAKPQCTRRLWERRSEPRSPRLPPYLKIYLSRLNYSAARGLFYCVRNLTLRFNGALQGRELRFRLCPHEPAGPRGR